MACGFDLPKKFGLKRQIPEEHAWILMQLSSNALTLAGFSFTSLVFIIGFLGASVSSTLKSSLLFSAITFAVAGEMARTSYSLEEYIVSEGVYLISLIVLLYDFIALTFEWLQGWGIIPIAAAIGGMFYVIWRTYANFRLLKKARRSSPSVQNPRV